MKSTIELSEKGGALASNKVFKVGIIGGGVAGSTVALKLSGLGIETMLFEANESLVSGPPICHLHAGGNLYRDISEQQCITLLEQSIETVRAYPHSVNRRPTVIAIPTSDSGEPSAILSRLDVLTAHYQSLVAQDPDNAVLGAPEDYYTLVSRKDMEALAQLPLPESPKTPQEWVIPVAHYMPHEKFKYPIVVVQEYGLSVFRLAATAALGLENSPHCELKLGHKVTDLVAENQGWTIQAQNVGGEVASQRVDYLINAAGFRTGIFDDIVAAPRKRWVEYKAAYVAHWPSKAGQWPEVIVHGERGTPQGMAQLTPYPQGFIQLHGMTQEITLFEGGLVKSDSETAYPPLPESMVVKADGGWEWSEIRERTSRAISHFANWLPAFEQAEVGGKPLCGAQQIPGDDPSLRAADASFEGERYARVELVKASSALQAANRILEQLEALHGVKLPAGWNTPTLSLTESLSEAQVVEKAKSLTALRGYPEALAIPFPVK
ncbi:FAD-dependent oxidoreductase [Grimontia sp. NTOU-MAR1]|uniref:FAD-dependent oxidoreductase n=1 Tax=Grimontia sp. NTOU-MAR1 TaxID=3111011 RepID=UPI002DBA6ACB|nr:FAD-dependent oxidoreductase [Grimontia sp. NTOU-MAR1]WRV97374.1 FAD-dependent oxidoreductase [Grimontia sp. NTOU-MAR1]